MTLRRLTPTPRPAGSLAALDLYEPHRPRRPALRFAGDTVHESEGTLEGIPYRKVPLEAPSLAPHAEFVEPFALLVLDAESSRHRYAHELAALAERGVHVIRNRPDEIRAFRRGVRRPSANLSSTG